MTELHDPRNTLMQMRHLLDGAANRLDTVLAETPGVPFTRGGKDVAAERYRHTSRLGWTAEHDAGHAAGVLLRAGLTYAAVEEAVTPMLANAIYADIWPWNPERLLEIARKPLRRRLVIAASLIVAEIDRLDAEAERKILDRVDQMNITAGPER